MENRLIFKNFDNEDEVLKKYIVSIGNKVEKGHNIITIRKFLSLKKRM